MSAISPSWGHFKDGGREYAPSYCVTSQLYKGPKLGWEFDEEKRFARKIRTGAKAKLRFIDRAEMF